MSSNKTQRKKTGIEYNTDTVARGVGLCLLRDFRSVHGKDFLKGFEQDLMKSPKVFREFVFPDYSRVNAPLFKAHAQMENIFKKYRFADDVYTDAELEQLTTDKFVESQVRISSHTVDTYLTSKVWREARKIAKSILGVYDPDDIIISAEFGKKSSIGCPLSLAHIDYKLSSVKAITGSKQLTAWFRNQVLSGDSVLTRILADKPIVTGEFATELETEFLALQQVPKSWKINRDITPLSLIGLFYSHGIGNVITVKLKEAGLDIRYLQGIHQRLVKKFSRDRSHTTADLSAASNSITSAICNRVLPRDWFNAVKQTFVRQLKVKRGEEEFSMYTESILPMGNGATFPLETLIFYSVIKAIGNLANVRGKGNIFSVYGDDLIYPSSIHKYVRHIFPKLGFILNEDKTFCTEHFRESCGSDYYRGVDVRPFFFPGTHRELSRSRYVVELYKIYNGLIRRFDVSEIRSTLYFLLRELALTGLPIMRVPPSYPDTSGVHVGSPGEIPLELDVTLYSPIYTSFSRGSIKTVFAYMSEQAVKRFVPYLEPYYWLALQSKSDTSEFWGSTRSRAIDKSLTRGFRFTVPTVKWFKTREYRTYRVNGVLRKKRTTRQKPWVAEKQLTTVLKQETHVADWI